MEEYGIWYISSAFALKVHIGVDISVCLLKDVAEGNILIRLYRNVYVYRVSSGMEGIVCNVAMEEYGI